MDSNEVSTGQRAYEPQDSGLESIVADTNQSGTVRRVSGFSGSGRIWPPGRRIKTGHYRFSPKMGWLTVAAMRPSLAAAWNNPCFVIPREMAGAPIPESQLDFMYPATKRLFAVYREAFGS